MNVCPRCGHRPLQPIVGHDKDAPLSHVILAYFCSQCESNFVTEMIELEKALDWLMKTRSECPSNTRDQDR